MGRARHDKVVRPGNEPTSVNLRKQTGRLSSAVNPFHLALPVSYQN